jgi:micrococcal nuclease
VRPAGARALVTLVAAITGLAVTACGPAVTPSSGDGGVTPSPSPLDTPIDVVDGDTLTDGSGTRHRLLGVNAPDSGECLAHEATARLAAVAGDRPGVVEGDPAVDQFGRSLVYLYPEDGPLANETLVKEGLAIATHGGGALQSRIWAAQDRAREAGEGVWDPSACGSGPIPPVAVAEVRHDPPGPDGDVLDEEWVVLVNHGEMPVDLGGWTVRDESSVHRFRFPAGTTMAPGERLVVTSGAGPLGFGTGEPIWNNGGDTAILVDEDGRFVAISAYDGEG